MSMLPTTEFGLLTSITLGLFALAVLQALAALGYRLLARYREERQQALRARWEPAVVQHLVAGTPAAEVHKQVATDQGLQFVAILIRFARRLAGEERDLISQLATPHLPAVEERARSRSPAIRARAVQTLGELGWPEYAPTVVAALDDRSPMVAMVAARMLCRPQAARHANEVVRRLDRFSTWTPMLLASMLANAGPEIATELRAALTDGSRPPHVRTSAAEALRQLNDFDSADLAVDVLHSETDREVLAATLRLVGTVGRSAHIASVASFMDSADFVIRVATADALAGLGGPNELQALRRMVLSDPSQWVALRAARSLLTAGWFEELHELARSGHLRAPVATQVLAEAGAR